MATKAKGQTRIIIYPDWCKGCGICAAFCPAKVFELGPDGKARAARPEDCVNCGFCECHCPDFAIKLTPKDHLKNGVAPTPPPQVAPQVAPEQDPERADKEG